MRQALTLLLCGAASCSGADTTPSDAAGPDAPGASCVSDPSLELPGVRIDVRPARWSYTLAEAAAGLTFPYRVVVEQELQDVTSVRQDDGQCDGPGASGLAIFESIGGGDGQYYCICDVGLCPGGPVGPLTLLPGSYDETPFTWKGINWTGPSDFGNPEGPPFPAGTYTLAMSARGTAGGQPYELIVFCPLALTP